MSVVVISSIIGILTVMTVVTLVMASCQFVYVQFPVSQINDRDPQQRRYWLIISLNIIAIFGTYIGAVLLFSEFLIRTGSSHWYEFIVPVLLYDFAYYWAHRFMHHSKFLMRYLHGWHHLYRHPTAIDGLYQHPHEIVFGLSLLLCCVAVIGPVGIGAFVTVIFIHTLINTLDHANIKTGFKWLDYLIKSHDLHHSQRNVNFGFTPLWDYVFKTTPQAKNKHDQLQSTV